MRFAKATHSKATCMRCGHTYRYLEMKRELSGLWVCEDCFDGQYQALNHPQNFPAKFFPEGVLKHPNPDVQTSVPASVGTIFDIIFPQG